LDLTYRTRKWNCFRSVKHLPFSVRLIGALITHFVGH
jgi:hypothetical protein